MKKVTDKPDRLFALVVVSQEARSGVKGNPLVTKAGTRFIVRKQPTGWMPGVSSDRFDGEIPIDAMLFDSVESASAFAEQWAGHPWYCKSSGEYEVIEVQPRYRQVLDGYDAVQVIKEE